jgi:hypothetical protein
MRWTCANCPERQSHSARDAAKPPTPNALSSRLLLIAHRLLFSLRTFYKPLTPPLREAAQASLVQREQPKVTPGSWEALAAAFSFVGGIMATLFGILINVIAWVLGTELHPWLRRISTALFVLTIPLLIFAGYCLDWMEHKLNSHPKKTFSLPLVVRFKEERTLGRINKAFTGRKSHEDRPGNTRAAK